MRNYSVIRWILLVVLTTQGPGVESFLATTVSPANNNVQNKQSRHSATKQQQSDPDLIVPSGNYVKVSRRDYISSSYLAIWTASSLIINSKQASASDAVFRTKAFNLKEYTNSIVASKDTNVSPKEAYDVLAETIKPIAGATTQSSSNDDKSNNNPNRNRALDVGAGAGVSTQTLYEMGFTQMDAVDWSGLAWAENVVECPPSVKFYEMDDERFFHSQIIKKDSNKKYQVIVYNFAINLDKAIRVAQTYLDPTLENARLLAPANNQRDYWYKQTYYLLNSKGEVVWKSKQLVGAWDIQFQPDVTEDSCQGIWCPPYNGFVKQR